MHAPVRGRISVNPRGFGFLTVDAPAPAPAAEGAGAARPAARAGELTAFIVPPDLNPFLDGDIVSAGIVEAEPGRYTATGLALIERQRTELFGTVAMHGRRPHLRVDRLVANTDWPFRAGTAAELTEGMPVVAAIVGHEVVPVRVLAAGADLGLERCVARHGVRSVFPSAVLDAARASASSTLAALAGAPAPGEADRRAWPAPIGQRRDLRALPTVTIDGPSTTDIDDALSVIPAGPDGALRVLVSIADVDAFVPEGSPHDLEARERGTSVYLAGRVVPMLPDTISSEAGSLIEGADRLTITAELRLDPEGKITSVDLYESVIRSRARLTYDAVAEFLNAGRAAGVPEAVAPTLRWLRTASARLSAVRAARGGVEIDREEAYVTIDTETREPTQVAPRADGAAHRIVERLMVAANEAVAGWLVARGLPGIFRVHDEPTEDRVRTLERFVHNFGLEAGFGPRLTPLGLEAFEAQFRDAAVAPAIRTVLGEALGPARYTASPGAHFGLGAPLYLHFTSPIRRYSDLAVHRMVKAYLRGERSHRAGDEASELLSQHLNHRSRGAAKAEAERHRMLIARLFASRVGEVVEGNIVGIKPFGVIVQMTGTGATGTVATDALPGGPYRLLAAEHALVGEARRYQVGDRVRATIAAANEELGRVDLALIVDPADPPRE